MLSENDVRCIMTMHNLEYRSLKEFDFDREKYMQWHIEQLRNKLRKDIKFFNAVILMGMLMFVTVIFVYISR